MFKQSDKLKLPGHMALLRRRLCACMVSVRPLMFFFFLCDIWWLFAQAANGKVIFLSVTGWFQTDFGYN